MRLKYSRKALADISGSVRISNNTGFESLLKNCGNAACISSVEDAVI